MLWFFKGPQFLLKETLVVRDRNCREDTDMIRATVLFLSQLLRINTPHAPLHGKGPLGLHLGLSVLFGTLPLPEKQCPPYFQEPGPQMAKTPATPPLGIPSHFPHPTPQFFKPTSFFPAATRSKEDTRKSPCFLCFLLRAFNN